MTFSFVLNKLCASFFCGNFDSASQPGRDSEAFSLAEGRTENNDSEIHQNSEMEKLKQTSSEKSYPSEHNANEHTLQKSQEKHVCNVCNKVFKTHMKLLLHNTFLKDHCLQRKKQNQSPERKREANPQISKPLAGVILNKVNKKNYDDTDDEGNNVLIEPLLGESMKEHLSKFYEYFSHHCHYRI